MRGGIAQAVEQAADEQARGGDESEVRDLREAKLRAEVDEVRLLMKADLARQTNCGRRSRRQALRARVAEFRKAAGRRRPSGRARSRRAPSA